EVGLLRSRDETDRRGQPQRGSICRLNGDDAVLLQLAVHIFVPDIKMRFVFDQRAAERTNRIVESWIGFGQRGVQKEWPRDERRAAQEVRARSVELIRARRRDRVV